MSEIEEKCSYKDPENIKEILEQVKNTEKHNDIVKLIDNIFPGWILGWCEKYSSDYSHFQNNWRFVCKKMALSPLKVVIVDKIVFDNAEYSLIRVFCELLTLCGHSVRRKEEFIGCKVCGDAIPTELIYKQLIERQINVPGFWNIKCVNC